MMIIVCKIVENLEGKVESTGYQHFLLLLQGFQKAVS